MAIKGNKVLKIHSSDEIRKAIDGKTKVVDLGGKLMIPGFNDAHIYFHGLSKVNLNDLNSISDAVAAIKKFIKESSSKQWITGPWLAIHHVSRADSVKIKLFRLILNNYC